MHQPTALYVHIPFCHSNCTYCDFYRVSYRDAQATSFLDALRIEIASLPAGFRPRTVYVGGGTPSALREGQLESLLEMLVPFRQAAEEYTFEVNPRSATTPKIRLLADAGVSRVSFGAQTFVSRHLQTLGRGHGPEDIVRVYTLLRERIPSISFDLIFALPGESLAEWARDLELATRLEPDHLSVYSLTYEAGTPLAERAARGEIEPVHEDLEREMYLLAMTHLAAAGYEHYEVSNFSRPGHRSLHNQAYWEQEDYIGVGPGACSTLGSVRHVNLPDLDGYVRGLVDRGAPPRTVEQLSEETLLREFLLLRLRTGSGLSLEAFRRRAGKDLADYSQGSVDEMIAQGFLSREGDCLRLTTAGFCVADRVIVELMA